MWFRMGHQKWKGALNLHGSTLARNYDISLIVNNILTYSATEEKEEKEEEEEEEDKGKGHACVCVCVYFQVRMLLRNC